MKIRGLFAGMWFAGFFLVSLVAQGNVFGDLNDPGRDDRREAPHFSYPFNLVVRLQSARADGSLSSCSATLVGRNLLLTAIHCLRAPGMRPDLSLERPIRVFKNPFRPNATPEETRVTQVVAAGNLNPHEDGGGRTDWAILRIAAPWGEVGSFLPVQALLSQTDLDRRDLTLPGYSGDLLSGRLLTTSTDCSIREYDPASGRFLHDCDSAQGSSGAPILRCSGLNCTIIGLNVAQYPVDSAHPEVVDAGEYSARRANIGVDAREFIGALQRAIRGF